MYTYYKKGITSVVTHLVIICNVQQIPWNLRVFSKTFSRPVLMFFTISIHCIIYFLLIIVLTFLTFLSCIIFSSLHYFLFTQLTFLTIFSTFLVFWLQ